MSNIEWTDATWNPTVGCTRVSAGCKNCYAERVAHRGMTEAHRGLTVAGPKGPRWNGKVRLMPDRLDTPLRWRRPRRVFVNSMSDLFHPEVPFPFVAAVFGIMYYAKEHTFQVLTKRPERMREFMEWIEKPDSIALGKDGVVTDRISSPAQRCLLAASHIATGSPTGPLFGIHFIAKIKPKADAPISNHWPPPNIWLGTSVEDQAAADERMPHLLATPAAVRFLSCEPLLGPISLLNHRVCDQCGNSPFTLFRNDPLCKQNPQPVHDSPQCPLHWWPGDGCDGVLKQEVDWVIVGGESGPGARPCNVDWIRSIVKQCRDAKTACFVKQLGAYVVSDAMELADWPPTSEWRGDPATGLGRAKLRSKKGADMGEWPKALRVREFPS